jgi:CBS domain containing-hemolysin-like protein
MFCLVACPVLRQVFMLSDDALLDEQLVTRVLQSGHSRLPVLKWAAGARS